MPTPLTLLLEVVPLLLDDLRSAQGTATSFPPLEPSLEMVEVADGVAVVLGVVELVEELTEITAKSILPEDGFSTRSLIIPNV